jgi:mercuric ion transport protein
MTEIFGSRVERAASPLLTLGGIGAAFGLAACCALPMMLVGAGLGTAWLGGIAVYAALHRPAFLIVALAGLAGGAVLLWRQRNSITPALLWVTVVGLLLGLALLVLGVQED